jgi:hypothetical protein
MLEPVCLMLPMMPPTSLAISGSFIYDWTSSKITSDFLPCFEFSVSRAVMSSATSTVNPSENWSSGSTLLDAGKRAERSYDVDKTKNLAPERREHLQEQRRFPAPHPTDDKGRAAAIETLFEDWKILHGL